MLVHVLGGLGNGISGGEVTREGEELACNTKLVGCVGEALWR